MLEILYNLQQLKIAKEILYQQVLLAEKMGYKYKDMAKLFKQDKKLVDISKQTMTNLVDRL